jgi:phosphoglycolate phosphatase
MNIHYPLFSTMLKPFQLLVFDWDGTLMDSEGRIVTSYQSATTDFGLDYRSPRQIRQVIGLGLDEGIAALFPQMTPPQRAQFADRYHEYFWATTALPTPLFPNVAEILQSLLQAGYQLAVATGKSRHGLQRSLTETGLTELFSSTRCAEETCSKPNPQMLLEIMAELDVPKEETLMIGDSEFDLEMANNAGVASVAVTYGVHEQAQLLKCKPLRLFDELSELLGWLRG